MCRHLVTFLSRDGHKSYASYGADDYWSASANVNELCNAWELIGWEADNRFINWQMITSPWPIAITVERMGHTNESLNGVIEHWNILTGFN